ncbi:MAG: ComF family protein [Bacteroidales bacterium]|nr:ComF family protein [Bacteroidales bacterium]
MDKIFNGLKIKDFGVALLDMAMPRLCVVCASTLLLHERCICTSCLMDLPLTHFWKQSRNPMADRFNEQIQKALSSTSSPIPYEPYAYAVSLFFYNSESPYKSIPRHLKYEGGIASGRFFAAMLADRMKGSEFFSDIDLILPVPLHWRRRRKRGYNQAEVIASELASVLAVPMNSKLLLRTRYTQSQINVSVETKGENVRGAFALSKSVSKVKMPRHVLIVDDTFTTGSTLNACREALRTVWPPSVRISVATLAFVSAT